MDNDAELVEELIQRLEERGVPAGTWLVDIERARAALQQADDLLRQLKDALIRAAGASVLLATAFHLVA